MEGFRDKHKFNFFVVGADGFLGSSLVSHLKNQGYHVVGSTRRKDTISSCRVFLDVKDSINFKISNNITCVFIVAGISDYDLCDTDPDAWNINVKAIPNLVSRFLKAGAFVNFISTNLVFGGNQPWPKEDGSHYPNIAYSKQKSLSEAAVRSHAEKLGCLDRLAIVRITKLLAASTRPFPQWFTEWANGNVVRPFSDLIFAPISLSFAVKSLEILGENPVAGNFHLSGAENISYSEFAKVLARRIGVSNALIEPTTSVNMGVKVLFLPRYSGISMEKTSGLTGILPEPLESVVAYVAGGATVFNKSPQMHVFRKRESCRLCSSEDLTLVMPILPSPIADAFVGPNEKDRAQPLIPLNLYQCQDCGHVQSLDIVNPDLLFRDYIFRTSNSAGLVEHFRRYAEDILKEFNLASNSLVLEIGSNDGTLLHFLKEKGMRVQGIDPAVEISRQANELGVPTIPEFFTSELAAKIREDQGPAQLIVANNVFAHADQLADFTKGIATMLDQDALFVFEVSYLLDIIDNFMFDTVYHEHLSYHSIGPIAHFFSKHGLHLFDVQRNQSKGGSLRGFVQKKGGPQMERPIIIDMIEEETRRGLHGPEIFCDYGQKILDRKVAVLEFINRARKLGKSVVGYGASTTVTTLMYHFELFDKLDYLIDDNTAKHGLYSPGCHLEVKPSSALYDKKPDVVVVLAWQYANPIISKHGRYIDNGGRFVTPLPTLKIN